MIKKLKTKTWLQLIVMSDASNANCEERKAKIEIRSGFAVLEL